MPKNESIESGPAFRGSVARRLSALKEKLQDKKSDAYIVTTFDEHLNEYVPAYKQRLGAITSFSGSAGTALICSEGKHQLFVDSRYHLQAEQETDSELFEVHKLGLKDVPTPQQWLKQSAEKQAECRPNGFKLAFDPFTMTSTNYRQLSKSLAQKNSQLVPLTPNLVDQVWEDRASAPCRPFYLLDESMTGESAESKLARVREKMEENNVNALVLSKLDEIAWVSNLRGSDIDYNPVFEAYCVIELDQAFCFSMAEAPADVQTKLNNLFQFKPYTEYLNYLTTLSQKNIKIWLDPKSTSMGTFLSLQKHKPSKEELAALQFEQESPIVLFKALKNPTELQQIRKAHYHSAKAKIRSFAKLHRSFGKQPISEKMYSDWLYDEYASEDGFADLSFTNIVGFADNGAIIHYSQPSSEKLFEKGELLLIDSGIQIKGGTTDDTRTLSLGNPTEKQIRCYTRVLQAHIRLALQKFPEGTTGSALDAITRASLWNDGMDYGHGTGHGVGAFLNVHEGPHSISPLSHTMDLRPGMVVSNEPGYYEPGWGGIRLENLYVVALDESMPPPGGVPHFGGKRWLKFEPLTLIPFDQQLIDDSLLNHDEQQWLKNYHQLVLHEMSGHLEGNDLEWVEAACQ